jgi:hypothetical protein
MEANEYFIEYPVLQVRPYGLLVYARREYFRSRRKEPKPLKPEINHPDNNSTTNTKTLYTGKMTTYAKKRLKRAIQLMVASAKEKEAPNFKTGKTFKFKVNFITLTLPSSQGQITDKDIKRECLDNFIKRLKRKHKLGNYVWRAEKQKNGNLHFHIITDTYIHFEKIRNDWNGVLVKFGFIARFKEKHGHENPNSTDVHAVWKVRNLTQYFIKYMSKDEKEGMMVNGKLWDCSARLKTKKNCEFLLEGETEQVYNEAINDESLTTKHDPNFSLIFMDESQFCHYVRGELKLRWDEYLALIRGDDIPDEIKV